MFCVTETSMWFTFSNSPEMVHALPAEQTLTLSAVVEQLGRAFPKWLGAEAAVDAASGKVRAKRGAFDPLVSLETESQRFNASSARGKASTGSRNDVGVEWTTPSGAKFSAGRVFNQGAVKSPDSATGSSGTWAFGVKLPLGRGGGINDKSAQLDQARFGENLARQDAGLVWMSVRFEAAIAYWNWVAASRRLDLREELERLAAERAQLVAREVAEGARPAIDAREADSEVALRRTDTIKARRDWEKASFSLSKYLWNPDGSPAQVPGRDRVPADDTAVEPLSIADAAVEDGRRYAYENRPEMARLALERRVIAVDRRLAVNDRRPYIDVTVGPGLDLGDNGIGSTMKAGLSVAWPLNQNDPRGRLEEAVAKDRKLELDENLLRRTIALEVDDAVSAIRRAADRWSEARTAVVALRAVEDGERVRFREGDSSLFLLNQRERQRADAQLRWIDTKIEYHVALAQWGQATNREDSVGQPR
jgi:outer membrane protein TolC